MKNSSVRPAASVEEMASPMRIKHHSLVLQGEKSVNLERSQSVIGGVDQLFYLAWKTGGENLAVYQKKRGFDADVADSGSLLHLHASVACLCFPDPWILGYEQTLMKNRLRRRKQRLQELS